MSENLLKSSRWALLLIVATLISVVPARAQSSDTWKSIAIIGATTAAGAYVGHRVAGPTGAYVGAAVGATAGYAIDRRRRENQYYNNDYPYGYDGSYRNDNGYYGDDDPYYDDGGYNRNDRYGRNYPSRRR